MGAYTKLAILACMYGRLPRIKFSTFVWSCYLKWGIHGWECMGACLGNYSNCFVSIYCVICSLIVSVIHQCMPSVIIFVQWHIESRMTICHIICNVLYTYMAHPGHPYSTSILVYLLTLWLLTCRVQCVFLFYDRHVYIVYY